MEISIVTMSCDKIYKVKKIKSIAFYFRFQGFGPVFKDKIDIKYNKFLLIKRKVLKV
jgi:hypothetical protein